MLLHTVTTSCTLSTSAQLSCRGSLHEEIWLRRPPGFTGSFPPGTQWSLRRPVFGLRQAPREWHNTLRTTLAALGFAPSTDTSLPPFYILVYVDDLVFATADTAGLAHVKSELQKRHTCTDLGELRSLLLHLAAVSPQSSSSFGFSAFASGVTQHAKRVLRYLCSTSGMGLVLGGRSPVVLTGHADASWADDQATQRSSQGYTFSLGSGSVSWRATRSSSVLGSSCEAEIYAGAMAAQELRWLTYLLIDLGEPPRSPPVLYVDNKAMLALCREQRLEHRTKHIALRYFLARELQQRGQLRLAYGPLRPTLLMSSLRHLRLVIISASALSWVFLLCFALLDWSCDHLFSPTLPMGSIHLEANSTTQEFKLYHGKGGLYIGKAVLKNNVFVLDFVPDLGTADSDGIVTFTSWTHPPDLDPDFSPEGFWYSHTIPEAERTRALATIQHSAAVETTPPAAETTPAAAETTPAVANTASAAAETTAATSTPLAAAPGAAAPGAAAPGPRDAAPGPRDAAPGPHGADLAAACDAVPGPGAAASLCCPLLLSPPFFVSLLHVQPWNRGYGGGGYGGDGWCVSLPLLLLSLPLLQLPLGGGCEGVGEPGEWHWGGGCETSSPRPSEVGGGNESKGVAGVPTPLLLYLLCYLACCCCFLSSWCTHPGCVTAQTPAAGSYGGMLEYICNCL
ncbi:unnamed protein product [Closterium sp. NIES-53]